MYDRDLKNVVDSAKKEGKEEGFIAGVEHGVEQGIGQGVEQGITEGVITVATNLKAMGLPLADIVKATGLSKEEILKL